MVKTIHIRLDDDVYYGLIQLKGKLQVDEWKDLMRKIVENEQKLSL
ncbi:MAG: hypothetical protein L6243_00265 [Candidatus Altiarchaeales archaeon]|nr:hypothetical protein [Candidatus Altiarchaeales archaeon]